uniref:hypothetical protein n=1 Tax=Candidatus Scatomorpha intestinigallinarum TaxID=2840923 RepID=UPI0040291540
MAGASEPALSANAEKDKNNAAAISASTAIDIPFITATPLVLQNSISVRTGMCNTPYILYIIASSTTKCKIAKI